MMASSHAVFLLNATRRYSLATSIHVAAMMLKGADNWQNNFSTLRQTRREKLIKAGPDLRLVPIRSWGKNLEEGNKSPGLYFEEIQYIV